MIKYEVSDEKGNFKNVHELDYDDVMKIINQRKENVYIAFQYFYIDDGKNKNFTGMIGVEAFVKKAKPIKMWKVWYDESPCLIVDDYDIVKCEIDCAKENEEIDKLHYEEIIMSKLEYEILPEFQGW